jgi:hypothetical protein
MHLSDIAGSNTVLAWRDIAPDRMLATEIQEILIQIRILDGPPDGRFGKISLWALDAFLKLFAPGASALDSALATALLQAGPLPFRPGADFAGRVAQRMERLGYVLVRHPDCVNIVYIEGVDTSGAPNGNVPNRFNDVRMVLRFDGAGVPFGESWAATTEPGTIFTNAPQNTKGAARIAFNQFKAWIVGTHKDHEALVQVDDIDVHRDLNKDYQREGDVVDRGQFGINQHWGYDYPVNDITDASAGCLVGRTKQGHRDFMKRVKADARYGVSHGYRFHTAVLDGVALDQ